MVEDVVVFVCGIVGCCCGVGDVFLDYFVGGFGIYFGVVFVFYWIGCYYCFVFVGGDWFDVC